MAFPTWYEWLNAGVNVGNAVRTFNDPNVSALESVSAVINATSAFLTATGQLMPGAGGATAVTGLVVSKENIEVSLALLAESYSNVQQKLYPGSDQFSGSKFWRDNLSRWWRNVCHWRCYRKFFFIFLGSFDRNVRKFN